MPTSRAKFRPGDIVVVPFPYSDRFAEKKRPALVVSNADVASEGFVWCVMITSAKHSVSRHDHRIGDFRKAGLTADSIVRPVKIASIDPSRILRRAGALEPDETSALLVLIRSFIGPHSPI